MSSSDTWPCPALAREPLGPRTTMRVGGRAEWLLEPRTPEELRAAWSAARERGLEVRVLGGGANLIVEDGLHAGAVIATDRVARVFRPGAHSASPFEPQPPTEMALERTDDPRLVAWCGASMPSLVARASELGWSGLEGLSGVPGHIGGGVAMNAGGRYGDVWDVLEAVRVLEPDGSVRDLARADCTPRYRDGNLGPRIALAAVLRLAVDRPETVRARAREYLAEKTRVQPTWQRSCGCIFKNPDPARSDGRSAGRLIEDCGGKGRARGAARVSELHANFIVNEGGASAADVLGLIDEVRALVAERSGVELQIEAKIWRAAHT
jgi:UDP-N-acetylmuramate dehydrogenase